MSLHISFTCEQASVEESDIAEMAQEIIVKDCDLSLVIVKDLCDYSCSAWPSH